MDAYAPLLSPEFWVSALFSVAAFVAFVCLAIAEIRERLHGRGRYERTHGYNVRRAT